MLALTTNRASNRRQIMRRSSLAIFFSGSLRSTVAMAADMPAPDNYVPPSAAPVVTPFQGFYLGGFLGYGGPW